MQLRVPSWESNEIKGIWIPGWFHGAESLPTLVITDLSLLTYVRDKHLSCLSHWSFESLLQQLSCTLFTLQACKACKETVHHKFQGPKKIYHIPVVPSRSERGIFMCIYALTDIKWEKTWIDVCQVTEQNHVCSQLIKIKNSNFSSHTISTLKLLKDPVMCRLLPDTQIYNLE